jgi:hypothetical protein
LAAADLVLVFVVDFGVGFCATVRVDGGVTVRVGGAAVGTDAFSASGAGGNDAVVGSCVVD